MMPALVLHPSVALRSQIYLPGRSWQRTPPLGRVAFLGPSRQFHLSGGSFRDFFLGVVRRHKRFTHAVFLFGFRYYEDGATFSFLKGRRSCVSMHVECS